jgi:murein DD-endopeptidase MepM/ murein hydrolase activator NlpD
VDIYAPMGSEVFAVENGRVVEVGLFTSQFSIPYWNDTYFVIIKTSSGYCSKYAELNDVQVIVDEQIRSGQIIGYIGQVLDGKNIVKESPEYIKKLLQKGNESMLHFEFLKKTPFNSKQYLGGNWFGSKKPEYLINPSSLLNFSRDGYKK